MDDFFKQMHNNLNNRENPRFEEASWDDLASKMHPQLPEKKWLVSFWWLAIPLLGLLASNFSFFYKWNELNKRVTALDVEKDTVFILKNIYHTDTIFNTAFVKESGKDVMLQEGMAQSKLATSHAVFAFRIPAFGAGYFSSFSYPKKTFFKDNFSEKSSSLFYNKMPSALAKENTKSDFTKLDFTKLDYVENERINLSVVPPVASLQPQEVLAELIEIPVSFSNFDGQRSQRKGFRKRMYDLRRMLQPNGLRLGVLGGTGFSFSEDINNGRVLLFGLEGQLEFSNRLRLWLDATYLNSSYETERMGEGTGIPLEQSPAANFNFEQAEITMTALEYSAGIDCFFYKNKKIKPFIGFGYGSAFRFSGIINYSFEKDDHQGEDENMELERSLFEKQIHPDFFVFRTGLELQLSRHFSCNLLGSYRKTVGQDDLRFPALFCLQAGGFYKF